MKIPALITARRVATLLVTAAAVLAPASAQAAAKGPAPKLTIETAQCATGLAATDRQFTVTVLGVAKRSEDRVALRFRAQQRGPGDKKWVKVATLGGLGKWEVGTPGTALRYTKLLTPLAEETRYRVIVEGRALDSGGKVTSKVGRRTVNCVQPRQTADVRIRKVTYVGGSGSGEPFLTVVLRNAGLQAATPTLLTLQAADGTTLRTARIPGIKGNGTRVVRLPVASCERGQRVIAEPAAEADGVPADRDHVADVRCPGAAPASKARR